MKVFRNELHKQKKNSKERYKVINLYRKLNNNKITCGISFKLDK